MKRSKAVLLSTVFAAALVACNNPDDEWISGNQPDGQYKDTVVNKTQYRYYHGSWYPVYNNLINPGRYNGATYGDLASPSYTPSVRTGGFGESAHSSVGE